MIGAAEINTPLNQSVVFVRESDIILTSDTWNVLVKFDLGPYEEAIATLHEEVNSICNVTHRSWQFEEVQCARVLEFLENKLNSLR